MNLQMLKLAGKEFVIILKRDFQKLAAQAQRQTEDDYWTEVALEADAQFAASGEKPIPFEQFERELDARKSRGAPRRRQVGRLR